MYNLFLRFHLALFYISFRFKDKSAALLKDIVEATVKKTGVPVSFLVKMAETIFKSVANIQHSLSNGFSFSRNGSVHGCTDKIKVNMLRFSNATVDFNIYCGRKREC